MENSESSDTTLAPYLLDTALFVIRMRWKNSITLPVVEVTSEAVVYSDRDAISNYGKRRNSTIALIAEEERLIISVDDCEDPPIAEIIATIRDYLNVAFGWGGPYPTELPL